jgi:hypothetical protein
MLEKVGAAAEEARLPTAGDAGVDVAPYDNLVCAPIDIGAGRPATPHENTELALSLFPNDLIDLRTLSARGKCLTSPVDIRCKVKNSDRWIEIAIYKIASECT